MATQAGTGERGAEEGGIEGTGLRGRGGQGPFQPCLTCSAVFSLLWIMIASAPASVYARARRSACTAGGAAVVRVGGKGASQRAVRAVGGWGGSRAVVGR